MFEYIIKQGSEADFVQYETRTGDIINKESLKTSDDIKIDEDYFIKSFKDLSSGNIYMLFTLFAEGAHTNIVTNVDNVLFIDEDGDLSPCYFPDDCVDEVFVYTK